MAWGNRAELIVVTCSQSEPSIIRTGLTRDLVKPSKRPLGLVTANGEVLGDGDKEVELIFHFLQRNAEV